MRRLLEPLLHVKAVLSIPKLLRPYFLHERGLLTDLARSAWRALKLYMEQALQPPSGYQAGAVVCIQTFAQNLRWNPSCPRLAPDFHFERLLTTT